MVLCMSLILIHMYYCFVYIISLFQLHYSEIWVVVLINTVIIVTYFTWGQHSIFDIVIVKCKCAISKQKALQSIICQCYLYTWLTILLLLFRRSICAVLNHGSWVLSIQLLLVLILLGASMASLTSLLSRMSAMLWNNEHYGLFCVSVINTYV